MPIDRFIKERKTVWQRLEELLARLDQMTLHKLHREEVRELGRIYRRTASDLAIARAESRDPRLVNYLNSLVIRAHGRIYRADAQGGRRLRRMGRGGEHRHAAVEGEGVSPACPAAAEVPAESNSRRSLQVCSSSNSIR